MPVSVNKQVVIDYLRAREAKDLAKLDQVMSPGFSHGMVGREQDRDGLFEEVAHFPFSDFAYEVDALVEEAGHVACRYRFRGKAPGGKTTVFTGMFIARIEDGQLISGWGEYDVRTVKEALGNRSG